MSSNNEIIVEGPHCFCGKSRLDFRVKDSLSEIAIAQYKMLGMLASEFELRLRLLTNKHNIQPYNLSQAEKLIVRIYLDHISDEDREWLKKTRQIRNDVIHCKFKDLFKRLSKYSSFELNSNTHSIDLVNGGISNSTDDNDIFVNLLRLLERNADNFTASQIVMDVFERSLGILKAIGERNVRMEDIVSYITKNDIIKAFGLFCKKNTVNESVVIFFSHLILKCEAMPMISLEVSAAQCLIQVNDSGKIEIINDAGLVKFINCVNEVFTKRVNEENKERAEEMINSINISTSVKKE